MQEFGLDLRCHHLIQITSPKELEQDSDGNLHYPLVCDFKKKTLHAASFSKFGVNSLGPKNVTGGFRALPILVMFIPKE